MAKSEVDISDFPESYHEYLETIYRLKVKKGKDKKFVKNHEIASALEIKPPSVTEMLEKLQNRGLLKWVKRKGVHLTELGTQLAQKIIRNHIYLEIFFLRILGIQDPEVRHKLSCEIEHHVNLDLIDAIQQMIDVDLSLENAVDVTPEIVNNIKIRGKRYVENAKKLLDLYIEKLVVTLPEHESTFREARDAVLEEQTWE